MTEKLQEKIAQFQMMQNTLRALDQKERMISSAIEEFERARLALEDLKKSKGAAYVPLGANNFVLGEIKDNENVLISVGSGIAVKKKREQALEATNEKIKEFINESNRVGKEISRLTAQALKLQQEIEDMRK